MINKFINFEILYFIFISYFLIWPHNKNTRRDICHLCLNKYKADLVFGDSHNYQRTFPLKYNSEGGYSSNNPIISNNDQNNLM